MMSQAVGWYMQYVGQLYYVNPCSLDRDISDYCPLRTFVRFDDVHGCSSQRLKATLGGVLIIVLLYE